MCEVNLLINNKYDKIKALKQMDQCDKKHKYLTVKNKIYSKYFEVAESDLVKAYTELENDDSFWALEKLQSSVTMFLYGLSIKKKGLLPGSYVCCENLIIALELISENQYNVIDSIRDKRNENMYNAIKRMDLSILDVEELCEKFKKRMGEFS
jgi:HEPN domain-containing protein